MNPNSDIAISVQGVSKTFRIPHERINSVRGAFVNALKKKSYEEFKALDNVSFEVKKGEFFGIIGRNGSGKSTLLKILAGIYEPDAVESRVWSGVKGLAKGKVHPVKSGEAGPAKRVFNRVKIHGRISPFLELGIGFNHELSGRDNIYLNATVLGLTKKQIDEKFNSIVAFSELERFIDQKLKNYSSGMQVRLAFSVAIHANRDILLMDEVLAVGDFNFQSKCISEFNKYKHLGKTIILVTHDILTIQRYCDRVLLLRNGKLEMVGKPEKVSNEYIYQNMSDEEKRIVLEEKNRRVKVEKYVNERKVKEKTEQKKNKIAVIKSIEFLDKEYNKKFLFNTGDDIIVRILFDAKDNLGKFNFGVGLYNSQAIYITGVHTLLDKIDTKKYLEQRYIDLIFPKIVLKTDSYFIKASICGEDIRPYYDFLDRSSLFKVITKGLNQEGAVNLEYYWS